MARFNYEIYLKLGKVGLNHFFISITTRDAERCSKEEVDTLKKSIDVAKVKAETDVTSASMLIAR